MATVYHQLNPATATFLASGFPQLTQTNGTNSPVRGLAFDASVEEAAFFRWRAVNYGSGNITVDVLWYADTASIGDVVWGAQIAAITPNADSQDVETDTFPATDTVTDSHIGTVGQRLHLASINVTGLDSIAANDDIVLRFYRDADTAADTMTGDAIVVGLNVSYSDL